ACAEDKIDDHPFLFAYARRGSDPEFLGDAPKSWGDTCPEAAVAAGLHVLIIVVGVPSGALSGLKSACNFVGAIHVMEEPVPDKVGDLVAVGLKAGVKVSGSRCFLGRGDQVVQKVAETPGNFVTVGAVPRGEGIYGFGGC
ncbi:hypothetical protein DYB28_011173, partial [Aphanomyces astaci]